MMSRFARLAMSIGQPRARYLLVALALFIGVSLAMAMAWFIVTSRHAVIDAAVREMRNDALMLAEQEDRQLQAVGVVAFGLIEHMREMGVGSPEKFEQLAAVPEMRPNLQDRIAGLSYITELALADRHGNLVAFSGEPPPPQSDAADRNLIRALADAVGPQILISEPSRSQLTGEWTIKLGRRFEAADGGLIGFVLSTIRIDQFEQFYARLPLTGDGAYELYHSDGVLIARYPHVDAAIGKASPGR